MTTFNFIQVNSRNVSETLSQLKGNKCIGFEVVTPQIIDFLEINVDPQHTGGVYFGTALEVENKSAALWVLGKLPTIDPDYQKVVVIEKADIDSIAAAALWCNAVELSAMENDPQNHDVFLALCNRVKTIDAVDCGIGNIPGKEWNPDYYKNNLIKEVTDFNILGAMCSDFKFPLEQKVEAMKHWLLTNDLSHLQRYANQVSEEYLAQKDSVVKDKLYYFPTDDGGEKEIELYFVQSTARGATGLLYSHAPFGVCFNPEFSTPNGEIRKFTICEFTANRYLNLQGILDDIAQIESGWGGNLSAGIIGSPFAGTSLSPDTVCEIVAKHVK